MKPEDFIDIPDSVLAELKKQLKKYIYLDSKPGGYEELLRYVALEKATRTQLSKLNSFANNHSSINKEDKEKSEVLYKMIVFAQQWIQHDKLKKELSNKVRLDTSHVTGTKNKNQSGREVDRSNSNLTSFKQKKIEEHTLPILQQRILQIIKIIC